MIKAKNLYKSIGNSEILKDINLELKKGEINDVDLKGFDIREVEFKGRAQRKFPPVIATGDKRERGAADFPLRILE